MNQEILDSWEHCNFMSWLLMCKSVTEGQGYGIVIATGDNTVMGRIAILTGNTRNKKTLLQLEIQRFVRIIAILALSTGTLCMIMA